MRLRFPKNDTNIILFDAPGGQGTCEQDPKTNGLIHDFSTTSVEPKIIEQRMVNISQNFNLALVS